jgi:hypothetical protein
MQRFSAGAKFNFSAMMTLRCDLFYLFNKQGMCQRES